ncbi:YciI-like protein [Rhizobium alvei]|uniref:YciI-like protein n=1 Tax=Rhizobium alvei TaxID=1132659 RepID=A0ABT8YMJ4_9HYPH|nr:YciI-like protein [Rhizobium alvei]MDO6964893.1 YciI-like protein [Rhizobium alvei]
MLYAMICQDKPGALQLRLDTRPVHVDYLNGLNAAGTLKFAGPFLDGEGKPNGSLVVVEAETIEAAKAIADADPYAKAGLFASVEVRAWNWVFNKPEA